MEQPHPSGMEDPGEKKAIPEPGRRPSSDTEPASALSWTSSLHEKHISLVSKLPSLWYSAIAAWSE